MVAQSEENKGVELTGGGGNARRVWRHEREVIFKV
jgi:hypothetical protein